MPPAWHKRPRLTTPLPEKPESEKVGAAVGSAHNATVKVEENK